MPTPSHTSMGSQCFFNAWKTNNYSNVTFVCKDGDKTLSASTSKTLCGVQLWLSQLGWHLNPKMQTELEIIDQTSFLLQQNQKRLCWQIKLIKSNTVGKTVMWHKIINALMMRGEQTEYMEQSWWVSANSWEGTSERGQAVWRREEGNWWRKSEKRAQRNKK